MSKQFFEGFTNDLLSEENINRYKPLIGREDELNTLIEVLNRKEKPNPVLIGEAGVGKTAIVEGLAVKISQNDVPSKLQGVELHELKLGRLIQKGMMMGSIESVVDEFCKSIVEYDTPVILFVDELHTMMDNGKPMQSGLADAFKPYLARGEIRLIGCTTLNEYRQIEQDKAMERRLTPVYVAEPSFDDAVLMLEGLKETYEQYHEVTYDEGVLPFIVKSAQRYIQDRVLPDKAIDLLDIVGAKRNLSYPTIDTEEFDTQLNTLEDDIFPLVNEDRYPEAYPKVVELKELEQAREQYIQTQKESREVIITVRDVKHILEGHLNVEIDIELDEDEDITRLANLESHIKMHVIGQDEAVERVSNAIVSHRLGLRNPKKPIGTFMFYGPSGVGKTELAKQVAKELYGSEDNLLRLDMGEYQEPHTISKLLGSPAGYVGFGNGKNAFESLRKKPNQVVLVDEFEKAAPNIQNVFLSILDEGHVTDQENNRVNFKESIIIFTSNAKPSSETDAPTVGFGSVTNRDSNKEIVVRFNEFRPEFVNRLDGIIKFNDMTKDMLLTILDLRINDLNDLYHDMGYTVTLSDDAKELLVSQSLDKGMGARPLNRNLTKLVETQMQQRLLSGDRNKVFNFDVVGGEIVLGDFNTVASHVNALLRHQGVQPNKLTMN